MNIDRRLEAMRERLERSKPVRMTLTLANGEVLNTDPCGAIRAFQERPEGDILNVTTDRTDYAELAGLLTALCR
ncbi:hypothetical protein N510_001888 [Firmicutes bacterium ASF500]|nr:hypothetical protein N510_001888 [Firmicutes bacterium ASF500]